MRVSFYTLGCKVNQYETQAMKEQFLQNGFVVVQPSEQADVFIINSCTVTAAGDQKTRNRIHRFRRENPDSLVVLTGCFPQAFPDKARALEGIDIITGANTKTKIVSMVLEALSDKNKIVSIDPCSKADPFEQMSVSHFSDKTRAFVKIEDGCDQFCTYCIIPYARGRVRSKPLDELKSELETLAAHGYKEVVLVGINLSSYGKDTGHKLFDAVQLACEIKGLLRVRLGSLEPELLSAHDIKKLAENKKFCPQFHLSLQSGSDTILKRMNRHYDTALYKEITDQIYASFGNPSITTDIIVGFPGESDEEFEHSLNFAKEIGFAKIHSFPYSSREGTKAATMPNQLTRAQKEQRNRKLVKLASELSQTFLQNQLQKEHWVLLETPIGPDRYQGYSENYTPFVIEQAGLKQNDIVHVKATRLTDENDHCVGELV